MTDPTLINEQHYYLFAINLDRCTGKCNILDKLSDKVCISNEIQDLNLLDFNMNVSLIIKNVTWIKSGIA